MYSTSTYVRVVRTRHRPSNFKFTFTLKAARPAFVEIGSVRFSPPSIRLAGHYYYWLVLKLNRCNKRYLFVYLGLLSHACHEALFQGFQLSSTYVDKVIEALIPLRRRPLRFNAECSVGQRIGLSSSRSAQRGEDSTEAQSSSLFMVKKKFAECLWPHRATVCAER
jgi:hypothetical protein